MTRKHHKAHMFWAAAALALAAGLPGGWASAHGLVRDGHERGISALAWVELGGIALASICLVASAFYKGKRPPGGGPKPQA